MNRRYMGETRNVGVARQLAEEENELVDCADGMDVMDVDELENEIEEEYVWVFHDDEH